MLRINEMESGAFLVSGMQTEPDGIYIPLKQFAAEVGVRESTVRVWKRRKKIPAINIFGRDFVKRGTQIFDKRCKKLKKPKEQK